MSCFSSDLSTCGLSSQHHTYGLRESLRPVCLRVFGGWVEDKDEILSFVITPRFQRGEHGVDAGLELGVEADAAVVDVEEDGLLWVVGCSNDARVVPASG